MHIQCKAASVFFPNNTFRLWGLKLLCYEMFVLYFVASLQGSVQFLFSIIEKNIFLINFISFLLNLWRIEWF